MRRLSLIACTALMLAACSPPAPKAPEAPAESIAPPAAEAAQVADPRIPEFADCTWGKVTAGGLSIWSYDCPTLRLVADDALPGFQREATDPEGKVWRQPAIHIFTKPADAPIEAILDAVRAASPGSDACVIEAGANGDFVLMPTGETLQAYTDYVEGKTADGPGQPCGPYGPSEVGGRTFRVVEGAPDKVVMIDWGSEIQVFQPDTLAPAN